MSGLTPTAYGNEPSGLQDVLAFIADFEMEDAASSVNHDSDDWMEDDASTSDNQQGKVHDMDLPEFVADGGRRPSPTNSEIGPHQALLLSTNAPSNSMKSKCDADEGTSKTPRRHRVSRKEELEYLRQKVIDMEVKLKKLKSNAEGGSGSPTPSQPATPADEKAAMQLEQSIALWKKMAERQKGQRELVESENAKLREKLKTQMRMAKSLHRILRKRERTAEQVHNENGRGSDSCKVSPICRSLLPQIMSEEPKRLKPLLQGAYSPSGGEFDELVQRLEGLYIMTNECMATCPVASGAQPQLREQDVKYNDFTGMFLEFQQSKLVPFDIGAVSRATWRHMSEPGIKFNAYFEEVRC